MQKISVEDRLVYIKTVIMVGSVLVVFGIYFWWVKIYTNKQNVFNAMIVNNLSSFGISRSNSDETAGNSFKQIAQAQFGVTSLVEAKVNITQSTEDGQLNVVTRTIATPHEDFMQYSLIDMPTPKGRPRVNLDSVLGQWAKMSSLEGGGKIFSEIAYGIVPFGNFPRSQRSELINMIRSRNVYKVDFSKTEVIKEHGRDIYKYKVSVNPKSYAEVLKTFDQMLGRQQMAQLDPGQYSDMQPIEVVLGVDKLSRTLVSVSYDENKTESYNGYGVRKTVDLPKTELSQQELEFKLQNLLQ